MTTERKIRALAGTVILLSLGLSQIVSPYWLILTAFAGFNLLQSAFTGFCPPEYFFRWQDRKKGKSEKKSCCCG